MTTANNDKQKLRTSSVTHRRAVAAGSFKTAADTIGSVEYGMSLFAITRGQFSMIDAVLHVLDQVGPANVSLWTWTVAEYEIQCLERLMLDRRLTGGRMVIDGGARKKNAAIIRQWKDAFGTDSVRYVANHAKIATVQNGQFKVLLRGSMNLNFNPRFEQMDITEGGGDFDLVKDIEDSLPVLPDDATCAQVWSASKLNDAFDSQTLNLFGDVKVWAK